MSDENAPIVVTLKGGKDFSDPWIVLRGSNPEQVTNMLRNLGDLPQAVVEASNFFHGTNNAAPLLPGTPDAGASNPDNRATRPAQASGWGSSPQQQQFQGQQGAPLHPEGKQCSVCGQVLQFGKTRTNKGQWKCPQYRWNNGNPNEHTLEWAN